MAEKEARQRGRLRAAVEIRTTADAPMRGLAQPAKVDWRKEEEKRLKAEIGALEKRLNEFDKEEAAEQVRQSLDLELRRKRLRLEENQLEAGR